MPSASSTPSPWKKRLLVAAGALILILLALFLLNRRFILRAVSYDKTTDIVAADWYTPMEPVAGAFETPLPTTSPTVASIDPQALATVARYAEDHESRALLVVHRGEIALERYWHGFTAASRSNAMSMVKTFNAVLIGILISEGHLTSEDEPVANYLPEWAEDQRAAITIRHLLQMESGLRNRNSLSDPFSDFVQMYLGDDAHRTALSVPAAEAPGMRWQYNNVNSQILGVLIERVTGKRYADYLSEKIWKPLGAQDAAMWLDRPGGNVRTFCCFFATPRDWARVGLLFQNGGTIGGKRLFPAAWLARMLTASQFEPDYGYQVWLGFSENGRRKRHRSEPLIARDMFWLDGHDIQRVYVIPSYQLVIVRIGEWSGGMWDDALIPNTLVRAIRPAGETP